MLFAGWDVVPDSNIKVVGTARLIPIQMSPWLTCLQAEYNLDPSKKSPSPKSKVLEMVVVFKSDPFSIYQAPLLKDAFTPSDFGFPKLPGFLDILRDCNEKSPSLPITYGSEIIRYLEKESDIMPGVEVGGLIAWRTAQFCIALEPKLTPKERKVISEYTSAGVQLFDQMKVLAEEGPEKMKVLGIHPGAPPELAKITKDVRYQFTFFPEIHDVGVEAHFLGKAT